MMDDNLKLFLVRNVCGKNDTSTKINTLFLTVVMVAEHLYLMLSGMQKIHISANHPNVWGATYELIVELLGGQTIVTARVCRSRNVHGNNLTVQVLYTSVGTRNNRRRYARIVHFRRSARWTSTRGINSYPLRRQPLIPPNFVLYIQSSDVFVWINCTCAVACETNIEWTSGSCISDQRRGTI